MSDVRALRGPVYVLTARKASARARMVHVCRVDVRILTIPKNTDNP